MLGSGRQAAAVDLSTEMVAVGVIESSWGVGDRRLRWMELANSSTEAAAVGVVESSWGVGGRWQWWIRRQRWWQWVWWSRAGEWEAGGGGGSVDRDGSSWCGGVKLSSLMKVAVVVDLSTEMAAVGVIESTLGVSGRRWWWICRQRQWQWV